MPWKVNGERWHLGPKGFPVGKKTVWDVSILPEMLKIVQSAVKEAQTEWDSREFVTFRLPGATKSWARMKTKDPTCLELRLLGKPGAFNLSRLEGLGVEPQIQSDRADGGDTIILRFAQSEQFKAAPLKKFLAEHAAKFLEQFGR